MKSNDLLNLGNRILQNINMVKVNENEYIENTQCPHDCFNDDNFNKTQLQRDNELIAKSYLQFKALLKPECKLEHAHNIDEIHRLINHQLNPLLFSLDHTNESILNTLFQNNSEFSNIRDPRFKEYYLLRVCLNKLKKRIKKEDPHLIHYSYTLVNLNKLLEKVDRYLINYLLTILLILNAGAILNFTRKKKKPYCHDDGPLPPSRPPV